MKRSIIRFTSIAAVAVGAGLFSVAVRARDKTTPPDPKSPDVVLNGDSVSLSAAGGPPNWVAVQKSNATGTIRLSPGSTVPCHINVAAGITLGQYSVLSVTGIGTLSTPVAMSHAAGARLAPTGGAAIIADAIFGDITLSGDSGGNMFGAYQGNYLQVQCDGCWTVTGDNSSQKWNTSVVSGTLRIAKGASLGSGGANVAPHCTIALAAGAAMAGDLRFEKDSTLDLADGRIGDCTVHGKFSGPVGGAVHIRFDLNKDGADRLIIGGVTNNCDIKDVVDLHLLGDTLTPGVYTLVLNADPATNMAENHFGFDFHGDPADHRNIVYDKVVQVGHAKYLLKLCTAEDVSREQKVTLTVSLAH